jgi:hypothetical protein
LLRCNFRPIDNDGKARSEPAAPTAMATTSAAPPMVSSS